MRKKTGKRIYENYRYFLSKIDEGWFKEVYKELLWIMRYILRYKKSIIVYIVLGSIATLLSLFGSIVSKYLIDAVTHKDFNLLIIMMVMFLLTSLISIVLNAWTTKTLTIMGLTIHREILEDVYDKILNTKWTVLNEYRSGDLLNRLNGDVSSISHGVLNWLPNFIIKTVHFLGSLIIIIYYDPTMALIALCSAPATFLASRILMKYLRVYSKKMMESRSQMMSFTNESFQQLQSIKSLHLIDLFKNRLDHVQENYISTTIEYTHFSLKTSTALSAMNLVVSCCCIGWSVTRLWNGYISYGTMTMFLQLARTLSSDFSQLIHMVPSAITTATSAGRVMELIDLKKEDGGNQDNVNQMKEESYQGLGVILKGISVSYNDKHSVLDEINFSVYPGEIVAIIGKSGSGKTTLLRYILGIVDAQSGDGCIYSYGGNKEPIGALTRQLMSYVPQGNTVFSGTIADNLRMVSLDATDQDIEEALKVACAWDFVQQLPHGINSFVGEKGIGLSEGQAQRIAIARAVLKESPIILFDEATSALDKKTGKEILQNIKKKMSWCTCIIVTHRTSLLDLCDKIYELEDHHLKEGDGILNE